MPDPTTDIVADLEKVVGPLLAEIPAVAKVEQVLKDNPWITSETVDDIKFAVDVLTGDTAAIEPDIKAALVAAPIPGPWNLIVDSDPVAQAVASQVVKLMQQRAAANKAGKVGPTPAAS